MDLEEWRSVVGNDWNRLKDAPRKVKADRLAVLGAVRQNGWAIAYAEPELLADQEIVMEAARAGVREQELIRRQQQEAAASDRLQESYGILSEVLQTSMTQARIGGSYIAAAVDQISAAASEHLSDPGATLARAGEALGRASENLLEGTASVGEVMHSSRTVQDVLAKDVSGGRAGDVLQKASEKIMEGTAAVGGAVHDSHLVDDLFSAGPLAGTRSRPDLSMDDRSSSRGVEVAEGEATLCPQDGSRTMQASRSVPMPPTSMGSTATNPDATQAANTEVDPQPSPMLAALRSPDGTVVVAEACQGQADACFL